MGIPKNEVAADNQLRRMEEVSKSPVPEGPTRPICS